APALRCRPPSQGKDAVPSETVGPVRALHDRMRIFCDMDEQVVLWGENLFNKLYEIYRPKSRFCVIFISQQHRCLCRPPPTVARDVRSYADGEDRHLEIRRELEQEERRRARRAPGGVQRLLEGACGVNNQAPGSV